MGWSYSEISLDDLLKVIKGFIDMLILASGYQSSGRLAHWDSQNIKNFFQWAIFLEDMLRRLRSSDDHQDSVSELDAALSELTSNPSFPQGLKHISSESLCQARDLILKHLVHTLPLRDTHLRALISAFVELDIQELQRITSDGLHLYLERLMLDPPKTPTSTGSNISARNCTYASPGTQSSICKSHSEGGFTMCAVQELGRRQFELSCLSAAETGMDVLSRIIRKNNSNELGAALLGEKQQCVTTFLAEERPIEPVTWSHWKSRSLSYLLDKRTIRMVSGANLLFSAPKHQWVEVIGRMGASAETDDCYEKRELLLLGIIGRKWSSLIEKLVPSSNECVTISKLYHQVQNLLSGRLQNPCFEEDMSPEEKAILEYLEESLSNQLPWIWTLLPILPAMAIPLRSPLFRSYLIELENQMRGDSSAKRCNCITDGKNHTDCEVAERIWCLYIFHVCGSW